MGSFDDLRRATVTDAAQIKEELVLALHAEDLRVTKRQVVRTVQVHRKTLSHESAFSEELARTGVVIEHVPVGRFVDEEPPVREEGDVTILPVVEEVVVVTRRLRLVEEIRIRRVRSTSTHAETVTLREQQVVVTRSDPVTHPGQTVAETTTIQPNPRSFSMNETIVAVYDTAAHAEMAVADLLAAHVPHSAIHRHAAEGSYSPANTSVTTRREETGGFWSNLFGGESTDHSVYDKSIESGGNVVSVTTVPEHDYEAVMAILEKHNPVDIDERAATYGTTGMTAGAATMATGTAASAYSTGMTTSAGMTSSAGMATAEGGVMRLAEEELAVGKRLVNRGGTRVRRYVVETPVTESVTLHEEKVTLERRPVTDGRAVTDADFTDKTIELTEMAEEAVVSKTARVTEEVALGKTATDRTETIHDTLRKEEVEVVQVPGTGTTTSTTVTGTTSATTPKI